MAYKKLFEPGRIGGLTIRNRAVMSPMGTDLADIRGNATPRLIAYYTERAKGGIGLIINEYTGVDDVDSIPTQHNLRMAQDYNVQEAEELTRSVHAYGAKIFAQLHHGGATSKSAFTGRQNLSPSGVPMAPGGEVPREMTLEDIKRVQEKFIAAAIRCKKAGYDGVELHGAHSYLIAQFFSKYYNRRTDAYGGSLENRCRFIDEIIAGIRAKLGRYPISVRICGDVASNFEQPSCLYRFRSFGPSILSCTLIHAIFSPACLYDGYAVGSHHSLPGKPGWSLAGTVSLASCGASGSGFFS